MTRFTETLPRNTRRMEEYRIEECFTLNRSDPDHGRVIPRAVVTKLQDEKAQLVHDLRANKRKLADREIRVVSPPTRITRHNNILTVVLQ